IKFLTIVMAAAAVTPMLAYAQAHDDHAGHTSQPAPTDARDPHAYSGGFVRNAGQYARPPAEALMTSEMHRFRSLSFDRLEYVEGRDDAWMAYEGEAWYGGTYNRAVVKLEGEAADNRLQESELQ